ncbi:hypothetical protein [Azospirillum argentinense]
MVLRFRENGSAVALLQRGSPRTGPCLIQFRHSAAEEIEAAN